MTSALQAAFAKIDAAIQGSSQSLFAHRLFGPWSSFSRQDFLIRHNLDGLEPGDRIALVRQKLLSDRKQASSTFRNPQSYRQCLARLLIEEGREIRRTKAIARMCVRNAAE